LRCQCPPHSASTIRAESHPIFKLTRHSGVERTNSTSAITDVLCNARRLPELIAGTGDARGVLTLLHTYFSSLRQLVFDLSSLRVVDIDLLHHVLSYTIGLMTVHAEEVAEIAAVDHAVTSR